MNIIEVNDLSFAYENNPVLTNINLVIKNGDFVGIVGSNGAGKSTLLKLMLGVLTPTVGSIQMLGTNISAFKNWSKIGYVPQNSSSLGSGFPATAEELVKVNLFSQVGFLRFPVKKHTAQAMHALEMVGMLDCAKRMISNLSGGQQQRIMLARVLVNEPEILILDEPTTGIDANAAQSLYDLLNKLNKELGITIVMVTHDIARASCYIDRTLYLSNNGITEENERRACNF